MKEVNKTPFVSALLQAAVGEGVDTSELRVFEVTATSTIALRGKKNTVFDRAKISPNTIAQLARAVNNEPIPLMMDHDMRGTPYGKFFYAESIPTDLGETELRGYLYVDPSETKIITKLNSSSIDEVSIQFLSEKILCSECGFDYKQAMAEDNYMPLILLECEEGHKIGVNGVHTNIVGLEDVVELSLVSRGAAKNSKIIAPSDAKLGKEAQRLAAAGVELDNIYCTASMGDQGEEEVDFKELSAKLSSLTDDKIELSTKLNAATSENTRLEGVVTERDETITALTAERDDLKTQLEAASEEGDLDADQTAALNGLIGKQYVALKALDGDTDAKVLDEVALMVDYITGNETRLSALIPAGGASQGAGSGETEEEQKARAAEARLSATADSYRS
tara:strand:+ start:14530 stop:15708 length:1179 start_codon:yes stop_codon:yes gene_type:complete